MKVAIVKQSGAVDLTNQKKNKSNVFNSGVNFRQSANVSEQQDSMVKTQPKKEISIDELKEKQIVLRDQISEKLKTETNPEKIQKLTQLKATLEILLEKENTPNNAVKTDKVSFEGYAEKQAAKTLVHKHSAIAAGIGALMSQIPVGDEVALLGNDLVMARAIAKVYNLDSRSEAISSTVTGLVANQVGTIVFTKAITWIPGVGNGVNAAVAFGVTEAVGHAFIKLCEAGL